MSTKITVFIFGFVCAALCNFVRSTEQYSYTQDISYNSYIFENISSAYFKYIDKVYASLQGDNRNISSICRNETRLLFELAENNYPNAIKFLDATGKPISGILEGGVSFLGFFSECLAANIQPGPNISKYETHFFSGKYCLTEISISNSSESTNIPLASWAVLMQSQKKPVIGFCIPSSCSQQDISYAVVNNALEKISGVNAKPLQCYTKNSEFSKDVAALCVLTVFCIFIAVTLCATVYDMYVTHLKPMFLKAPQIAGTASTEMLCEVRETTTTRKSRMLQCVLAFSVLINAKKLLTVESTAGSNIAALHGLRFLSMVLIIFGHTFSFATLNLFIRNPGATLTAPKDFVSQIFSNGTFAVDTFYLISGLLVAFVTLKGLAKRDGKLPILYYYFHRYFRLTPLMMAVIAFCAVLLRYIGSGPNWLSAIQMYDVWCKDNWWINALYLHNFIKTDNMCLSHSWYLATDMQFYLLTPLLLIPLYKNIMWGKAVLIVFFVATTLTTAIITGLKNYPAIPYVNNVVPLELMNEYYRDVYIKPYCRIGPYLIGIAVGYVLVKRKELILKKIYVALFWLLSIAMGLIIIYIMWPANQGYLPTSLEAAIYGSLARSVWALCLAWLVIACVYGYAGFINTLLSWSPLVPLSRLTYCAYLIHPVVMNAYYGGFEATVDFSFSFMVYIFLGNAVMTYVLSFFITLVFESPFIGIEKALLS